MQDPKNRQNSPSGHHRTTLSGYIFATKARIDNRKKCQTAMSPHMSWQYGELRPTSSWDLLASLRHSSKFQRVSRLGSVTTRRSSRPSGREPNFAALNAGATYIRQGGHHVGHWPTFLVVFVFLGLVSSVLCQAVGSEEHRQNDLFCVEWDTKR